MEKHFSTKAGTPRLCVSVGDTWRWGFWVDLIPVPSLHPSSPQQKRSTYSLSSYSLRISKEKKRLLPFPLEVCRNPGDPTMQGQMMREEISTPITRDGKAWFISAMDLWHDSGILRATTFVIYKVNRVQCLQTHRVKQGYTYLNRLSLLLSCSHVNIRNVSYHNGQAFT